MNEVTRAEASRLAIITFRTVADALLLRGYYRMSGTVGERLENALRDLSPEIYGTLNDPRICELQGLKYIIDRLPKGIERCNRIVMIAQEDLEGTSFEKIVPAKRRRISYRIAEDEMSFAITRVETEIYDILTHFTFLYIEAKKIHHNMTDDQGQYTKEWLAIEEIVNKGEDLNGENLDRALWNLSALLGRTYKEVKEVYAYLEKSKNESNACSGLFYIIYNLGKTIEAEVTEKKHLEIHFTPALAHTILPQIYGKKWAAFIKEQLGTLGLSGRPLHIISANLHSVLNVLYGYAAYQHATGKTAEGDLYGLVNQLRKEGIQVKEFAEEHGFLHVIDSSGSQIDYQIIDTSRLQAVSFHPELKIESQREQDKKPVILVMDYAFGTQAFELMDELLKPAVENGAEKKLKVKSISVMGKAGILPGKKGDIILATAHVLEGIPHNYIVANDLDRSDFHETVDIYEGPIITVLGTSLQNRDVLEKFQHSGWKAVGLEMEGAHYHRAINAAIIQGSISKDVKVRYAYYASDNPLLSGETLASGSLGSEGVKPTYMITKAIVQKILNG